MSSYQQRKSLKEKLLSSNFDVKERSFSSMKKLGQNRRKNDTLKLQKKFKFDYTTEHKLNNIANTEPIKTKVKQ